MIDFLMPLIYDNDSLNIIEVYKIPVTDVRRIGLKAGDRFRWTLETQKSCEKFKVFSNSYALNS